MSKVNKSSIYIDGYNLHKVLYSAQFCMAKADRIIAGNAMLEHCGNFIACFIKAFEIESRRLDFITEMIAEWEITKLYLRMAIEHHLIHSKTSTIDKDHTFGFAPGSIERQIFELTSKIDDGIAKWKSSTLKARASAL